MKIIYKAISVLIAITMLLCACSPDAAGPSSSTPGSTAAVASGDVSESATISAAPVEDFTDDTKIAVGEFDVTSSGEGAAVSAEGGVYTVTAAGEYTFSGALQGQIVVDAPEDAEVKLILNGVSVSCSNSAPILIKSALEVTVKSEEGTYNTVDDLRTGDPSAAESSEENYDAVIYAACDLKLTGKGTLVVTSSYDNGVKTKDDLSVKNVSLKVTCPGNALKGNDSVTVRSGSLILVSTASDGVKTSNSDVSSKGNARGNVTISGGTVYIYAACDGMSAARDVYINEDEEACSVNVFTASYAGEQSGGSEMYLILSRSDYSSSMDYYAVFYNGDVAEGKSVKCGFDSMVYSGRTAYYGLSFTAPEGYSSVMFTSVEAGGSPDLSELASSASGEAVNANMNAYLVQSASGKVFSGDWVNLTSGSGSSKTTYSSKGIKAENEIYVSAGSVNVKAMDDGLHANAGEKLEDGTVGSGNINISGGNIAIVSADDGMHADGELNVTGSTIDIVESHEGLEANVVNLGGGKVTVYANDDGINACAGSTTPLVNITGGTLDVTTPSGDTDAVDSNGAFSMSGGVAIIKGGSQNGGMAGSVDVDRTLSVTGGTILAFGGICETPSGGSGACVYVSQGTSFSAGDYALKDGSGNSIAEFTLSASYSSVWIASDQMTVGGNYTLEKDDTSVLSWDQTSSSVGSAGGGYGPGGGGRPGGGRR